MKFRAAIGIAAVIALITPGAAFAKTNNTFDPLGDQTATDSPPVGSHEMDITKFTTTYKRTGITVRIKVAAMDIDDVNRVEVMMLGTNGYLVLISGKFDQTSSEFGVLNGSSLRQLSRIGCSGFSASVKQSAKLMTFKVPAGCVGGASAIKTAAATTALFAAGGELYDDVNYEGSFTGPWVPKRHAR